MEQYGKLPEWQPIETAPKNGTEIVLVVTDGFVGQLAFNAHWVRNRNGGECWSVALPGTTPTHWMPLPDPPS